MATVNIPICTNDMRRPLKAATNLKNTILPKNLKFEVYLQVDKELQEQIEDDAVLAEKLFKKVSIEYKKTVADLAAVATDIDREFGKELKPKGWVEKEWQKRAPDVFEDAEARMLTESRKTIKKWQQVRKDRKSYVIKSAVKVTIGSLSVATASLGTAIAIGGVVTTGGAAVPGLVAAIYANLKAVVALGKLLRRLKRDVDEAEEELQNQLSHLIKAYTANSKGQVAAKELGKAAVEQFFAVSMKSISNGENAMFDFKGKLDKVEINLSKMGIKLNKALTDQAAMDKQIEGKIVKMLKQANYKSKKLPKLTAASKKLNTAINELLADIPVAIQKVDGARARHRSVYKPAMVNLKAKKPEWVQYGEAALKLGDLALGAGFTDFSALDSILVLVDSIGVEFDDVLAEKLL